MATTQRSEGVNRFLKYFKRTLSLHEFVIQYDRALTSRREKEKRQDFISHQTKPNLKTSWQAEARASEIYTTKIFLKFQDEYVHTLDMFIDSIGQDGTLCEYRVSSFASRSRTVTFNVAENIVKCNYKKYEFLGILCAHALKVIHSMQLSDLPSSCYLKRWTKDKRLDTLVDNNGESVHVEYYPSLSLQSSELTRMALKITKKGVSSTNFMEFTKGCLARVQEEVDDFLKATPEEVTNLEGDENLSTTKVGEVTNQDLAGANIMLHDKPRKMRNGKAGRIKGVLEKGKGKKRICPMQNGKFLQAIF
ncbi:hypothetical protein GIB67_035156 [Kingdonia uniflora]|uniref:Protein FAR1-RELATED SEQUENCE n=1 Tax=Kingdonia uniflora TaxID=39325 RepID=A0A7J7LDV4_9MAGN|nr:hypothetical protein GIB67_035156 [Kingdonia uniflora]